MSQQPSKEDMIELIGRMQAHINRGGSPFDCPSMHAPVEQKREIQRAINDIFNKQFKESLTGDVQSC